MHTGNVELVSVSTAGDPANQDCDDPGVSADGKVVSFTCAATNLVEGDVNSWIDVFVHDRSTRTTELISQSTDEDQANQRAWLPAISGDGAWVVWISGATNLDSRDTDPTYDVFLRSRFDRTTTLVSVNSTAEKGNNTSWNPGISHDGQRVVFASTADNLVPSDWNGTQDIFLHAVESGQTSRVSVNSSEAQGNDFSFHPRISANGEFVVFASSSDNLVLNDTNSQQDVFVRDLVAGTTERVSVSTTGVQADSYMLDATISSDGDLVAFSSDAENLVTTDSNDEQDIFVHDRSTGETLRVNLSASGAQASLGSSEYAVISPDGRSVAFVSYASNLVPGDTKGLLDAFVAAVDVQ